MRFKRFIFIFAILSTFLLNFGFAKAANQNTAPLTFQARVDYQRAIEEVYWRHRIWPKENPGPKPTLEKFLPDSAIIAKVDDYLRKSNALEQYWQRPITTQQLQAEMDRMVKNTKEPKLLKEIFSALNNDPHVIAECLARPAIVDRLIHNWYANDDRFHGELRQRVQNELRGITAQNMRGLSGKYSEVERVKGIDSKLISDPSKIGMNADEWKEWTDHLQGIFGKQIQTQKLSQVLEETDRIYVMTVLEKGNDRIKIATVEWTKTSFDSWWSVERNNISNEIIEEFVTYSLKPLDASSQCIDDTWTPTQAPLPEARDGHLAVWTGTEMIVWGGWNGSVLTSGGRYDPSTDSWTAMNTVNAPEPRSGPTAVWTGLEMIVWGGILNYETALSSGGRYNPSTDSWTATGYNGAAPDGRFGHTAIWTGAEMIIWAGAAISETPDPLETPNGHTAILNRSGDDYLVGSRTMGFEIVVTSSGGRYDPSTDSWTSTNMNAPSGRYGHSAVWTENEMIVWGGIDEIGEPFSTGARYDPSTDSWIPTSNINVPDARSGHVALWTGAEMIIWGSFLTGARYNPSTDSWTPISNENAPVPSTAVWTGNEMIVWGGTGSNPISSGARYDPSTDTWTLTSSINVPDARVGHTALWTGDEMIIWGGWGDVGWLSSGGRYDPSTDSWTPTINYNVPQSRIWNSAVWTGAEMIIWGGLGYHSDTNEQNLSSGARYDPATDSWIPTSKLNVPDGRFDHTAIWTGNEMIIWGGRTNDVHLFSSGGRYNPSTDTWEATSDTNVPTARTSHTAVWTGSEIIVWGGANNGLLSTGGRYHPSTDCWTSTNTVNVPEGRILHTAIWTGTEMIVWGGGGSSNDPLSTGGRYSPFTDSWSPTSTTNVPAARTRHTAVWTGSEMIVWGNYFLPTGGKYNPSTDGWTPTSLVEAPEPRGGHSAAWTGTEMIIWGGYWAARLSSGARYDPSTDSWRATTDDNAPGARSYHSAVWTGNQMIVWGGDGGASGSLQTGGLYCVGANLQISDASIEEGKKGGKTLKFIVTLSTPLDFAMKVDYATADGTATEAGNDYVAKSGTKRIRRGETTTTIKIKVRGDKIAEGDETFTVNLTNAVGVGIADPEGVGTIMNDD